jgi:hypothetical protein
MAGEGAKMSIVEFDVFGAKALAGIGRLPDTVSDRAIPIRLRRRSRTEPVERFRYRAVEPLAAPIRSSLRFHLGQLDLSGASPDIPGELDDRAADGWEPLLAIADAAGGSWPVRARRAALVLSADREVDEDSLSNLLLADLREIFEARRVDRLHTSDMITALNAMDERPWPSLYVKGLNANNLARLLKPYGVESKTVRVDQTPLKGYLRADLEDVWARYLPPGPPGDPEKGYGVTNITD